MTVRLSPGRLSRAPISSHCYAFCFCSSSVPEVVCPANIEYSTPNPLPNCRKTEHRRSQDNSVLHADVLGLQTKADLTLFSGCNCASDNDPVSASDGGSTFNARSILQSIQSLQLCDQVVIDLLALLYYVPGSHAAQHGGHCSTRHNG